MSDSLEVLRQALADRYRIDDVLGQGGMATVFRATDLKHGRAVALKVLAPELSAAVGEARFRREIEIAAGLQHPHIVPLLDSGQAGGSWFYVMPFVAGEALRARLERERQLAVPEALRLAAHVAGALAYAHRQGVVHRDIKPENILLADGRAMIADFGVARRVGTPTDRLTTTGMTLGSTLYMSPEQISADPTIDGRSDVYSLGCVLYEMLAGQPPFAGVTFESIAHQHLNVAPRRVSELRPTVPAEVDAIVAKALAKLAADRFARSEEMEAALEAVGTQATGQRASTMERAATGGGGSRGAESFDVAPTSPQSPNEPSRRRETLRPPSPPAASRTPGAEKRGTPRAFVAVALAALAVLALALSWRAGWFGSGAKPGAPRWVLLTDFEGGDAELTRAARDLVASTIDRSKTLATVQGDQIALALRSAGRPDTSALDATLAREIAVRASIPLVVSGSIRRAGGGYALVLRAIASRDERVLATVSDASPDERGLMRSVVRLTNELHARLAGGRRPGDSSAPMVAAITPSFEAFKAYMRGRRMTDDNQAVEALAMFREAVAMDPEFAAAYSGVGTAFSNLGHSDSAAMAYGEALRRSDRLTAFQRLDVAAKRADLVGDVDAAIAAYRRALSLDLNPMEAAVGHHNLGGQLQGAGYDAEAIVEFRRANASQPIEASGLTRWSIALSQIRMTQYDEASRTLDSLTRQQAGNLDILMAFGMRDWDRADSLAAARREDPRESPGRRTMATISYAGVRTVRGEIGAARVALDQVLATPATSAAAAKVMAHLARSWLAARTNEPPPPLAADMKATRWGEVLMALDAARRGDSTAVPRTPQPQAEVEPEDARAVKRLTRALLRSHQRRWSDAIAELEPLARRRPQIRNLIISELVNEARWLTAEAYEGLGQPESTATYLNLVATAPGAAIAHTRGFHHAFALQRLVMLECRLGRLEDAQRHWEELSALVTRPDPEYAAVLDRTRTAYFSARGMRASGAR